MTAASYCIGAETLSGGILCMAVLPNLKTEPKKVFYMKVVVNFISFLTI